MTDTANPGSTTPDRDRLMTIGEVSEQLRISRWSVYQLINNRQLKTFTIGTRRLIAPKDFHDFISQRRDQGDTDGR